MSERQGIPYSIGEARKAAQTHANLDPYHRDLILWLCDQVEQLQEAANEPTCKTRGGSGWTSNPPGNKCQLEQKEAEGVLTLSDAGSPARSAANETA